MLRSKETLRSKELLSKKEKARKRKLRWWHKNKERLLAERRSVRWSGNGKSI